MTHPQTPASPQTPVRGGVGTELPAARPSHRDRPNGETAARTTVLVGEGRGRRAATRVLLVAFLLLAVPETNWCSRPVAMEQR